MAVSVYLWLYVAHRAMNYVIVPALILYRLLLLMFLLIKYRMN